MKNEVIFFIAFLFCKSLLANAEPTDSVNINDVITVHIEQNMNSEREYQYSVNLFIYNQKLDTIRIRSSFTLDMPRGLSYILIYSCQHVSDSLICDYDLPRAAGNYVEPIIVEYNDRLLFLAPNNTV